MKYGKKGDEREMDEELYAEMEHVGSADDDGFPEFLFDVIYGVDESDRYYSIATEGEIPKQILEMKRKYMDINEWIRALDDYEAYLEKLGDKYGGVDIVLESYNSGSLEEYLPAKPKLKPTKKNKQYLKAGIIPTPDYDLGVEVDHRELAEAMFPYDPERGDLDTEDMYLPVPKKIKNMLNRSSRRVLGEKRAENIYASSQNDGADLLKQLIDSYTHGEFNLVESKSSYADQIADTIDAQYRDPDIEDFDLTSRESYISNGHAISKREEEEKQILTEMYALGIDFIGGKSSSHVVKLARKAVGYGDSGPMTKKQMKKYKKRNKAERRMLERRNVTDPALATLLQSNRRRYSSDAITRMTVSDLFQ